jgi:hypothetical protein
MVEGRLQRGIRSKHDVDDQAEYRGNHVGDPARPHPSGDGAELARRKKSCQPKRDDLPDERGTCQDQYCRRHGEPVWLQQTIDAAPQQQRTPADEGKAGEHHAEEDSPVDRFPFE